MLIHSEHWNSKDENPHCPSILGNKQAESSSTLTFDIEFEGAI